MTEDIDMKPAKARIDHLVVHNFKSFCGTQYIGPFLDFTGIIGPNGGGKSNIMDAISFVLGVRSADLRAGNVRELIYKSDDMTPPDAYVELSFINGDGSEMSFKRTINSSGASSYYINAHRHDQESYNETLESLGIFTKSKNFLVFQGQVESLAMKSGKDLTVLIEKVSGSDKFKADYEIAKHEQENSEEESRTISGRITYLKTEKKKLKEQRQKADEFNNLTNTIRQKQIKYNLLQFAAIEKEIQKKRAAIEEKTNLSHTILQDRDDCMNRLRACQSAKNDLDSRVANYMEQIQTKNELLLHKKPQLTRIVDKIQYMEQSVDKKVSDLNHKQDQFNNSAEKKQALEAELAKIDNEITSLLQVSTQNLSVDLNPAQQRTYFENKRQVGIKCFAEKSQLERLIREQSSKAYELEQTTNALQDSNHNLESLNNELKTINSKIGEVEEEQTKVNRSKKYSSHRYEELSSAFEVNKAKKAELTMKINALMSETRNLESNRAKRNKSAAMEEFYESLRKTKTGFKGVVRDLIKPIQTRYQTAMEKGLRMALNYLVVDTADSAARLNDILKEKNLLKSIIVLENMPEVRVSEAVRNVVGNRGNVLADLLTISEPGLEKILHYFGGSKVVTEDLETADQLKGIRGVKEVITLEGHIIRPGMITSGGNASQYKNRNVSTQKMDSHKEELAALQNELRELEQELQVDLELYNLRQSMSEDETTLASINERFSSLQNELANCRQAISDQRIDISSKNAAQTRIKKSIETQKKKIAKIQKEIVDAETNIFSKLLKEVGCAQLKDLEGQGLNEAEKNKEELSRLRNAYAKLEWEIDNLDVSNLIQEITLQKESIKRDEEQKLQLLNEQASLTTEVADVEKQHEIRRVESERLNVDIKEKSEETKECKSQLDKISRNYTKVEKEKATIEYELDQIYEKKRTELEELRLKNIEIPMHSEDEIDYSSVERYQELSIKQIEKACEGIAGKIEQSSKRIEELTATGRCVYNEEKYDATEQQLDQAKQALDIVTQNLSDCRQKFREAQQHRKDTFMTTFDQISRNIEHIYKEMTKSSKNHNFGGTALLYADDNIEPYNGGINYSPTPPGKRCMYEMDQLSGGEKTIAALSLLFAIHSANPAPFYILDEVDAHLDWENCALLLKYINGIAQDSTQCIIISHKDDFYQNVDSLVGTTFVPRDKCSRCFSLDLRSRGPKNIPSV